MYSFQPQSLPNVPAHHICFFCLFNPALTIESRAFEILQSHVCCSPVVLCILVFCLRHVFCFCVAVGVSPCGSHTCSGLSDLSCRGVYACVSVSDCVRVCSLSLSSVLVDRSVMICAWVVGWKRVECDIVCICMCVLVLLCCCVDPFYFVVFDFSFSDVQMRVYIFVIIPLLQFFSGL